MELSEERTEDGRLVLGATATPPDRFTHATAGQQPDGTWALTILPLDEPDLATAVTAAVLSEIDAHGGGAVTWWTHPSAPRNGGLTDGRDEALAEAVGLHRTRELFELAVPLPIDGGVAASVRPFRLGLDDATLLRINNAAFDWHPDQRDWDAARLAAKVQAGDLIADDVLLLEDAGDVVGFCWTKPHPHRDPPEGEIYVIAVDPAHHGKGLGRALTLAGLHHLRERYGVHVGMLFVEAGNDAARAMYERLGFTHRRTLRCYAR
jgi:mycothiol synthase